MKTYFTSKDLSRIKRNTSINNHGENYEFIAHKINSKLEREFKIINKKVEDIGYLPGDLNNKRYKLYQDLLEELKRKSPTEYEAVYQRL